MPQIVNDGGLDTPSVVALCSFNAKPIPASSYNVINNVYINKQKAKFIDVKKHNPLEDTIPGVPIPPNIACPSLPRTIKNVKNKTVFIGKSLVTVIGDETLIPGSTPRKIVGPPKHYNLFIANFS